MNDPHEEDSHFARPFLGRSLSASVEPAQPDAATTRPYLMTGGRTDSAIHVPIEALVSAAPSAAESRASLERRSILDIAATPIAVAEVALRLSIPLGVVRVLVADLIGEGLLSMSTARIPATHDVAMIERLIHGVASL